MTEKTLVQKLPEVEPVWHPDTELRFVLRDGEKVLQQKWTYWQFVVVSANGEKETLELDDYRSEWRDVPLIEEVK